MGMRIWTRCSQRENATTTSCSANLGRGLAQPARRSLLLLVGLLPACAEVETRPQVFVAASLHQAVTEVAREQGLEVALATAASSTLARQIEAGAPACVFLSANRRWMDYLADRGLLARDARRILAGNRLAWVARSPGVLRDRKAARSLAMGDPSHVPLGQYARDWLERQGTWQHWRDRILPTTSAPAAVRLVQAGEADLALAYATDARASGLRWAVVDGDAAVVYECAILRQQDSPAARRIYEALTGEAAARIYARHGFVPAAR